jgi:hypothetical protein
MTGMTILMVKAAYFVEVLLFAPEGKAALNLSTLSLYLSSISE